mgnify:CR=1 FL=1
MRSVFRSQRHQFPPPVRGQQWGQTDALLQRIDPKSAALRDWIPDLSYAIAEYGRVLVGELVPGDEASEARFRRAVGPLDAHREALARRARGGAEEPEEPEVDIDSPLPEVDPPTPPVVDDPPPVPADA